MEFQEMYQQEIQGLLCPTPKEVMREGKIRISDSKMLFSGKRVTEQYCRLYIFYLYWACKLLVAKSGLYRLDEKLEEQGYRSGALINNFYQKYNQMGLKYFYMRSFAHIERLTEEELSVLSQCMEGGDPEKAVAVVEKTYKKVLAESPDNPELWVQLFPSIHGEGNVKGDSCVIGVMLSPEYDENGMLKDIEQDERRIRASIRIKKLLEDRLPDFWGMGVAVILEE